MTLVTKGKTLVTEGKTLVTEEKTLVTKAKSIVTKAKTISEQREHLGNLGEVREDKSKFYKNQKTPLRG